MKDQEIINVLKALVIDGVHKAKSGHPGGAMSSMDFAYLLFSEFLVFNPENPKWLGRDRFILSAGHESMLLYAILHFMDWLDIDQLKQFRQLHSLTPGHPENTLTPGVECTTGPLGQGAAMSVGMAIAARFHSTKFGLEIFNPNIYALLGDGCMQEDITYGAASYAGHLKLNRLVWYYDRNMAQISGHIHRTFTENCAEVYRGLGWEVKELSGQGHQAIRSELQYSKDPTRTRPLLIIGQSKIASGAYSLEGSHHTHGAPLPPEERIKTKEKFGIENHHEFYVPQEAKLSFQKRFAKLKLNANQWEVQVFEKRQSSEDFNKYFRHSFPEYLATHESKMEDFSRLAPMKWDLKKPLATRSAFGQILATWADFIPNLMGGSADLEPSNMTEVFAKKVTDFQADNPGGRNLAFGVREFPMSAITNGMALFGGMIPFDATFLSFSDYSRPALRLGALQKVRVIHEFTHDSFYLGEDGPTHQPVEHLMSLRLIPGLNVMRPADAIETEIMMNIALKLKNQPSVLALSRQNLNFLPDEANTRKNAHYGAYIVLDHQDPNGILFATGSEVTLAIEAARLCKEINFRVVSVPCWEIFFSCDRNYVESIMSSSINFRVAIEAGSTLGWERFVGLNGLIIGRDQYGDSAPADILADYYGFTPVKVYQSILDFFRNKL